MKQYRLMILGASAAQLPIIFKALEMDYHVITVDNIPDNIGHNFSHQSVNCSTVDSIGVCKVARELKITGIVTFASDVATSTVAYVATSLQLQGCELKSAKTLSNKASFREFQRQQNLSHPAFFICQNKDELSRQYRKLNTSLMFKPVDTSGSRGITLLEGSDLSDYRQAFAYAQHFSRSGKVSIEEFVEGIDISGDGFLKNGQLCAVVSQKYKRGFIPTGHRFPTNISINKQQLIFSEVSSVCKALGYTDGPVDFDVKMLDDNQVIVIEMSPRLGGNGIPELIKYNTGIDLIEMTLRYALGENNILPEKVSTIKGCASWIFGSEMPGQIEHLATENQIKSKVEELIECRFNYQSGDTVAKFEHSGHSVGHALFDCPSELHYENIVMRLQSAIQLHVIPD